MILKRKRKKKTDEEVEEEKEVDGGRKTRRRARKDYEGSRWAALILLLLVLGLGVLFYLKGRGTLGFLERPGKGGVKSGAERAGEGSGWVGSTYVVE